MANNITITSINKDAFKKGKKFALLAGAIITSSAILIAAFTMGLNNKEASDKQQSTPPEDCIVMNITISADEYNVKDFFTEDIEDIYGSYKDYTNIIAKNNNLNPYENSFTGDITIPVIVDNDNPYYLKLKELQAELKELESNSYWVNYVVKNGESISHLAAKASGSFSDTIGITKEIIQKNGLSSSNIQIGQQLLIVNPQIGQLKMDIQQAQKNFYDSLCNKTQNDNIK